MAKVLCIDLDGTLIDSDMVLESIVLLLKKNPLYIFVLPFWVLRGKAYFKRAVAQRMDFDPARLHYHHDLIAFIRNERAHGRKVVLATASDEIIAQKIADHLGIFDEVIGSDGVNSYSGASKNQIMQAKYGVNNYDYAGNTYVDLKIWPDCGEVIVVSSSSHLLAKIKALNLPIRQFKGDGWPGWAQLKLIACLVLFYFGIAAVAVALIIHHWVK